MTTKAETRSDDQPEVTPLPAVESLSTSVNLTTPCTIQQLKNWLDSVSARTPGAAVTGQITTTTTSISASW